MGTLAEIIKEAAPGADEQTTAFLSRLNKLEGQVGDPAAAEADLQHMTSSLGLPTLKQEMWQDTLRTLAKIGLTSAQFGALLRSMRAQSEEEHRKQLMRDMGVFEGDVPGRGVRAPVSKSAGLALPLLAGTAVTSAGSRLIGSHLGNLGDVAKEQGEALKEHLFAQTGKATDNPWFYPLLLATVLGSGYSGYKGLDEKLEATRGERASRAIERARAEFERALSAQNQQAQMATDAGVKAGFVIDKLARAHISGELDEQLNSLTKLAAELAPEAEPAEGEQQQQPWTLGLGNKALGIYLATLALLTAAGAGAGYHGVKSHETSRRKYDVAKELLRRRSLSAPPVVTTEA